MYLNMNTIIPSIFVRFKITNIHNIIGNLNLLIRILHYIYNNIPHPVSLQYNILYSKYFFENLIKLFLFSVYLN